MNIAELLQEGKEELKDHSPTASLDAEVLLAHSLDWEKAQLISKSEDELDKDTITKYRQVLEGRKRGLPLPYLTNNKEFFGRNFFVNEEVLIPRPETEELVSFALLCLDNSSEIQFVYDIGTGSGAIGISLAQERIKISVMASDISEKALIVAKKNASSLDAKNISFIHSDLLENIPNNLNNSLIITNLPYIGTDTHTEIDINTKKFEPGTALFSGLDGLDHYRKLLDQLKKRSITESILLLEMGSSQGQDLKHLIEERFPSSQIEIHRDLAGLDRFISVYL
jgi:release factor glutamine methyltransferase